MTNPFTEFSYLCSSFSLDSLGFSGYMVMSSTDSDDSPAPHLLSNCPGYYLQSNVENMMTLFDTLSAREL